MFYGKGTRMFYEQILRRHDGSYPTFNIGALRKIKPAISFNAFSGLLKFLEFPKSLCGIR